MKALLLCLSLIPLTALADNPFDGTWVGNLESTKLPTKPIVLSLDKGTWQNKSQVPPVKVKADGTDQSVSGHAYYDTVAVRTISPTSAEVTGKKGGKVMFVNVWSVSDDGRTATVKWTDDTGTQTATGENVYTRVAAGPKGSNAVSGSWRPAKVENYSANALTVSYTQSADGLKMSAPTGQSYDAKFDGKEYPVAGDPGQTLVSLKRVNASNIIETDKRLGKVTDVINMKVAADGKTMHVSDDDKLAGTTTSFTLNKNP